MKVLSRLQTKKITWPNTHPEDEKRSSLSHNNKLRTAATRVQVSISPTIWQVGLIANFWKSKDPSKAAASEEEYQMLVERLRTYVMEMVRRSGQSKIGGEAPSARVSVTGLDTSNITTENPQTPDQKSKRAPLEPSRPRKRSRVENEKMASFNRNEDMSVIVEDSGSNTSAETAKIAKRHHDITLISPYANKKRKLGTAVRHDAPVQFGPLGRLAELKRVEHSPERKRKRTDTLNEGCKKQKVDAFQDQATAKSMQSDHRPTKTVVDLKALEGESMRERDGVQGAV